MSTYQDNILDQRTGTNKVQKGKNNSPVRRQVILSKHSLFARICIFIVFIYLATIVSITIVCLTSPKQTNQTCRYTFVRSGEEVDEYNSHPHHVAVGDFNQDGYLDLVVANSGSDSIGIFFNLQNGSFLSQIIYSTGEQSTPTAVAVGHFNNDTFLDIAVTNYAINSLGVFLNLGNGTFSTPILISLGSSRPLSLATAHFNHDNLTDIALINDGTYTVTILLAINNGLFQIKNSYFMGYDSMPYAIVASDLNKDQHVDLLIVNYGTSELVLLFNIENNNFIISKYFVGSGYNTHPLSIDVGDLNNDNISDIVVANSATNNIGIILRNNNGTLARMIPLSIDSRFSPQSVILIDFNNDTFLDILALDSINSNVLVLKGYGNGDFRLATIYSTGPNSNPSSFAIGDFDNDQKLDVVITDNRTNSVLILSSYVRHPETTGVSYSTGNSSVPSVLDLADFNNDGYLDIVVSNTGTGNVGIFINRGNGSFTDQQTYDMAGNFGSRSIKATDLNNDTYADIIAVLTVTSKIAILLGNGDGTFHYGNTYSTGSNSFPSMFVVGDFNNDTYADIISANTVADNLGIFFGFGDGTFTNMTTFFSGTRFYPYFIVSGDMNNDQILDIIITRSTRDGIYILIGNGNGSFQDPIVVSTDGDTASFLSIYDVNDDNRLDLIYTNVEYSYLGVLLSESDDLFSSITKYPTVRGALPSSASFGYYNDDTLIDMVVANRYDSSVSVYLGVGNGTFEASNKLTTGYLSQPVFVRFSDLDNNHQEDLVIVNNNINNIMVFSIEYNANFEKESNYLTGSSSHPYSVAVAYFNHNNRQLDVVVANSGTDEIEILFGYNGSSFMNTSFYSTGFTSHPQSVVVADFNRDQFLDIAVVNTWINTMNVFVGLDDGSFDSGNVYSTGIGSSPCSISAGDFNRDNRTDLVVANEATNNLAVFLSFDCIKFEYDLINVSGFLPNPFAIVANDFNNDQHMDLAVINKYISRLDVYLGYGNGSFSEPILYSITKTSAPISLAMGDFNNDTYPDLVVGNYRTSNIEVFLGYGNGSFRLYASYSIGDSSVQSSIAVADLNNDGRLDIVVATYDTGNIYVFQGHGDGSFTGQIIFSMLNESGPIWVAVSDLNNDTFPDLVVANNIANNICILFGDGYGNFKNVITLSTGDNSGPVSIAVGDLNNDNIIDMVIANRISSNILIFFGSQNGTFSSNKTYLVDSSFELGCVVLNDINNDTIIDILLANANYSNSAIIIFYGLGRDHFTSPAIYNTGTGSEPTSIVMADFNQDGKQDLAFTNSNQDTIGIMLQLKYVPFSSASQISVISQSQPKSVAVGDFNNDDQFDIIVANYGSDSITILLGDGNGNFENQLTFYVGENFTPISLAVSHLNDDHYLDVVVVSPTRNSIVILYGIGNGTFTNMTAYSTGPSSNPVSIAIDRLNNDSYFDLIVANWGTDEILVYYGTNNGSFFTPISYSVGYDAQPQSVKIGDLNNDNMSDIVVANYGTNYVEILLQTC